MAKTLGILSFFPMPFYNSVVATWCFHILAHRPFVIPFVTATLPHNDNTACTWSVFTVNIRNILKPIKPVFIKIWSYKHNDFLLRVQPTRCDFSQFIYFCKTLYTFQPVFPSVIRSTKLHIQRLTNAWRCMCRFLLLMMDGKPGWNMYSDLTEINWEK